MKKLLKLGLVITFAFVMMLSMTGCGNTKNNSTNDSKKQQENSQKENNVSGKDWIDIDEDNYAGILKDKTGIDLSKLGSFTVTDAYGASTKVAEVTGKYKSGTTKAGMFEKFIKELLRVSSNSIWSTDVNNNTYRIEKVNEYTDYDSFYNWKIQGNEDLSLSLSGSVYIDNYSINYTFTDTQFNVHIASYVIK